MTLATARTQIGRVTPKGWKISDAAIARAGGGSIWGSPTFRTREEIFRPREPAPGVLPAGQRIAFDDFGPIQTWAQDGYYGEGLAFIGYQYLAELTQRAEYRRISETIAKEMTRKWVRFKSKGGNDQTAKIADLMDACEELHLRERFCQAAEHDGFYGCANMFLDFGQWEGPELATPLIMSPAKIKKDGLKAIRLVEPMWVYPNDYSSNNPLRPDYYRPRSWFVMAQTVHKSRLLRFVSREVPDILKPAYMFGGLSLTQIAKPYVDNWLRTRQSVSDLLHSFSVSGILTDLSSMLAMGGGEEMFKRAELFNKVRDNRGIMLLDKETEEFFNVSTPLGSLDKLQAQSQEQMAAVTGIPLVKLLGITPSGLNASTDGEIRVFYDWVHAQQEHLFANNLRAVLDVIQLSTFGSIDPDIIFEFEPLWQLDDAGKAAITKTQADTDDLYMTQGVLSPDEVRERLAVDKEGPYGALDLSGEAPGPPAMEAGEDPSDETSNSIDKKAAEGSESGANSGV